MVGFKKRIISKQNLSSCLILMGQTAKNIALEILRWKYCCTTCCISISTLISSGWSPVGTLHLTSSTVHGACLTFALCFWLNERPDGSLSHFGFVSIFIDQISSFWVCVTLHNPLPLHSQPNSHVNMLSCVHYKKQSWPGKLLLLRTCGTKIEAFLVRFFCNAADTSAQHLPDQ